MKDKPVASVNSTLEWLDQSCPYLPCNNLELYSSKIVSFHFPPIKLNI